MVRAISFPTPKVEGLNFSFSGLKTGILYFLQKEMKANPNFIKENMHDLCASIQSKIVDILLDKFFRAAEQEGISQLCIAGGVSANGELRSKLAERSEANGKTCFIPSFQYCTDNAGMIAMAAHFADQEGRYAQQDLVPKSRMSMLE